MPLLTTIELAADFALGIYYHRKVLATSYVCYKSWITLFCEFFFREPILSFFLSLCPIYKFLAINFRQHSNREKWGAVVRQLLALYLGAKQVINGC